MLPNGLLSFLDTTAPTVPCDWREYRVAPISGGANNRLYRVAGRAGEFAVKFTLRDERDRAGREFAALQVLAEVGVECVPRAGLLDRDHYSLPVVVQTWLEGEVLSAPPANAADWTALCYHYCTIHHVGPQHTTQQLQPATINAASADAGRTLIAEHLGRIPLEARPVSLTALLSDFARTTLPEWNAPPVALCRVDSNWRNFLRRPGDWASVDWENSGWGDPAFEWADLMTHPAYATCAAPWDALIETYAERMNDETAPLRISTYTTIMLVWWVVRWARYLYEVPRGLDQRLVARPADWPQHAEREYARYLALAYERLAGSKTESFNRYS